MPGKILIVEDESLIALHLKRQLEQAGVVVVGMAENADDALTLAARHLPDLVLMDINIRGDRDGISVATELRASHGIPAMFLTAYADRETLDRAKVSQPLGYISKPFLGANLAPQIEMALHRSEMEHRLRASEEKYRNLVNDATELIYHADANGSITFCNPAAAEVFGCAPENAVSVSLPGLLHPADRRRTTRFYSKQRAAKQCDSYHEFRCVDRDGRTIWLGQNLRMLFGPRTPAPPAVRKGQPVRRRQREDTYAGFQAIARDITSEKDRDRELTQAAATDALTGLNNRGSLVRNLSIEIGKASRSGAPLTLCLCDLDRFKQINDAHGHRAGDDALVAFGTLLRDQLRRHDIAGRLGGDEFCLVFPDTALGEASTIVERLRERLSAVLVPVPGRDPFTITASFGTAQYRSGMAAADLLEAADAKMYDDKARPGAIFTPVSFRAT